jgi:amino acid adenylation domain-containing protein/non-ribosomal peptide synthase protein (TIGR01720 family)
MFFDCLILITSVFLLWRLFPFTRIKIQPQAIITQTFVYESNQDFLHQSSLEHIIFADDTDIYTRNYLDIACDMQSSDLAYLVYTSGTTGTAKGVMVEHGNLTAYMQAYFRIFPINSKDTTIQLVPFTFDLFNEELFLAITRGGTFVIPNHLEYRDIDKLIELIIKNDVSIISCSPLLLNEFNNMPKLQSVHTFINGGDILKQQYISNLITYADVYNLYGPAEATIGATEYKVNLADLENRISIGRPMANYKVYILDKNKKLLPIGIPGEIYIGGEGVARGYINRPELTDENFMEDIFRKNGRMYCTGDLGAWRSDGTIDFLGRIDNQVKIRGYRIELEEIERKLEEHTDITKAVVIAKENNNNHKYLCGYYTSDKVLDNKELEGFLSSELPDYMVPVYLIKIDEIPTTENGKIDVQALPEPSFHIKTDYERATNEVEHKLLEIWSDVLRINKETISMNDNFFELGGDSILSMQVVSKALKKGVSITVNQLFQFQTIKELAKAAKQEERSGGKEVRKDENGNVNLTPIQAWFFEQDLKNYNHYNQTILLEADKSVDHHIVQSCLHELIEHYSTFRLRYRKTDGIWKQEYVDNTSESYAFHVYDLKDVELENRWQETHEIIVELQKTLDITNGPLVNAAYFDYGSVEKGILFITVHHLVVDGYSWRILLEDFQYRYNCKVNQENVPSDERTLSFGKWSERLQEFADSTEIKGEFSYWDTQISKTPNMLPIDFEGGANKEAYSNIITMSLSKEETDALLYEIYRAYKTRINDILIAALAIAVEQWAGDVNIDIEGHGREKLLEEYDVSRTIGWFTSVYPVTLDFQNNINSFEELINRVKTKLRGIPNNGLGFGLLAYLTKDNSIKTRINEIPKAQICFNYLGQFDSLILENALFMPISQNVGPTHALEGERAYAIEIDCMIEHNQLRVDWKYSKKQYNYGTIEKLAKDFNDALRSITNYCLEKESCKYIPLDFPMVELKQNQIDTLTSKFNNIEDIYSLSPVQESMIFHHVYSPDSAVMVEQTIFSVKAKLDVEAFRKVWQTILNRHDSLRASFEWDDLGEPIQIIHNEINIPYEVFDWRNRGAHDSNHEVKRFLEDDRKKGFNLKEPPLMRISIIMLDDEDYRIIWTHHHLLLDGWCLNILLQEISALYENFTSNKTNLLEAVVPFKQYIEWLNKQDMLEAEKFWRENLKDFKNPIILNDYIANKATLKEDELAYGNVNLEMTDAVVEGLSNLAKKYKVTLNTLMHGAWAILLNRYSGEEDIVFGSTSSGRPVELENSEKIVGCIMNTMPIRIDVNQSEGLSSYFQDVQLRSAKTRRFDYTPLSIIRKCSEVSRESALYDLYESVIVFENYPFKGNLASSLGGLKIKHSAVEEQMDYPITLYFNMQPKLTLNVLFYKKYYDEKTMNQIVSSFSHILDELIGDEAETVGDLHIMPSHEYKKIVYDWNQTEMVYPKASCYYDLFEEQVVKHGDNIAVQQGDNKLSYRELNIISNKLANRLSKMGVGPDVLVGIYIEKSVEMISSILAVLKAGGAFIPIDSDYPIDRIDAMMEDSKASILITTKERGSDSLQSMETILYLDEAWDLIEKESDKRPVLKMTPQNLAYVIFTSGSSGRPKGVLMSHEAVVSHTIDIREQYALEPQDGVLQFSSISFDISLEQIFTTLASGANLILRDKEVWTPFELSRKCEEAGVSVANLPTAYWHQVVSDWGEDERLIPTCLRLVIVGGEQMLPEKVSKWNRSALTRICLLNAYGPAETAMTSTLYEVPVLADMELENVIPVGKPLANRRIYILNKQMQPVPIGVKGELYIGGIPVAKGYVNRPDLTNERFHIDLFYEKEEQSLYRTGDLGLFLSDGNIAILGRDDNQIKISGHRIELAEVEFSISEMDSIKNVAVVLKERNAEDRYMVAFYTSEIQVEPDQLREYLLKKLPDYMVPSYLIPIEAIPLTPNGKIDRKKLENLEITYDTAGSDTAMTEVEEKLIRIWEEMFDVEDIGRDSDFFELGGHSLKAITLISKIHQELNVELPLAELFEISTVKDLAAYIESINKTDYAVIEPIKDEDLSADGCYQASSAQKRLYTIYQLEKDSTNYNMPSISVVEGNLEKEKVEACFKKLIDRHETLRTSFEVCEGEVIQRIHDSVLFEIEYLESDEDEAEQAIAKFLRPFDLTKAPLLRVFLIKINENKSIFMFDLHHIIMDGISSENLIHEFVQLYQGYELSDLKLQYKDFTVWQNNFFESDAFKKQEEYWMSVFEGEIPELNIPLDYSRPAVLSYIGEIVDFAIDKELSDQVKVIASKSGTTVYVVLLAAFNILLSKYTAQDDIIVGTPIVGRTHLDLEPIIGMFVNTLALRNRPKGDRYVLDFIAEVKKNVLDATDNQDYQFEMLVDKLGIVRDLNRNPLFDIMFSYLVANEEQMEIEGLKFSPYHHETRISKFDLTLFAEEVKGNIRFELEYSTDIFKKETIEKMSEHYIKILKIMSEDINIMIKDIALEERVNEMIEIDDVEFNF